MTLGATVLQPEIVDCFADVADYLLNRGVVEFDGECYRSTAVEFYFFNNVHRDFATCMLLDNEHYNQKSWNSESLYGLVLPFGGRYSSSFHNRIWFNGRFMLKIEQDSYFGYAVVTDVANIDDGKTVTVRSLQKDSSTRYEWKDEPSLTPVNIVRNIRTCDFINFDDVYEYVSRIRQRVKAGIYCREDIAQSLLHFRRQRYRFEAYKSDY